MILQKDIENYLEVDKNNYYEEDSNHLLMMKFWNYMKSKSMKIRNKIKLQSSYCINDMLEQYSDNESDKTEFEKIVKYNNRCRKSYSKKNNFYNKSTETNKAKYYKRIKSLNIIRDNYENYEIVLHYQKYIETIC